MKIGLIFYNHPVKTTWGEGEKVTIDTEIFRINSSPLKYLMWVSELNIDWKVVIVEL